MLQDNLYHYITDAIAYKNHSADQNHLPPAGEVGISVGMELFSYLYAL